MEKISRQLRSWLKSGRWRLNLVVAILLFCISLFFIGPQVVFNDELVVYGAIRFGEYIDLETLKELYAEQGRELPESLAAKFIDNKVGPSFTGGSFDIPPYEDFDLDLHLMPLDRMNPEFLDAQRQLDPEDNRLLLELGPQARWLAVELDIVNSTFYNLTGFNVTVPSDWEMSQGLESPFHLAARESKRFAYNVPTGNLENREFKVTISYEPEVGIARLRPIDLIVLGAWITFVVAVFWQILRA